MLEAVAREIDDLFGLVRNQRPIILGFRRLSAAIRKRLAAAEPAATNYVGFEEATMANLAGESNDEILRLDFDRRLMLQFRGSAEKNLSALADLSGQWIDLVHARRPPRGVVLDRQHL